MLALKLKLKTKKSSKKSEIQSLPFTFPNQRKEDKSNVTLAQRLNPFLERNVICNLSYRKGFDNYKFSL